MTQRNRPARVRHDEAETRPMAERANHLLRRNSIVMAFIVFCIVLSIASPYFLTISNWESFIQLAAPLGIVAIAETLVILTAGIDLSSGPSVGFTAMFAGLLMTEGHVSTPAAVVLALMLGGVIGLINGLLITRLRLPPFIVTLGVGAIATGMTLVISRGNTVYQFPAAYQAIGNATIGGVPLAAVILILLFLLFAAILRYTVFGRHLYAFGGSREAVTLAGINARRLELGVYLLAGVLYAVAGIVESSILQAATPATGQNLILTPIAAVVIGGTSLFGGIGSLGGTLVGVLILSVIENGLSLLNVSPFYTDVVYGCVVLVAIALDILKHKDFART